MRKPKLEIDLKPLIEKKVLEVRTEKQKMVLQYTIEKLGFGRSFKKEKLVLSTEYISTHNASVLTFRYDGVFLFREITIDKEGLHFKYLIEESQTK